MAGLAVVGGLLLAAEIGRRAVAHSVETTNPALAARIDPADPAAWVIRANQRVGPMLAGGARGAGGDLGQAAADARRALSKAPLEEEALRDLAMVAGARGESARSSALLERAARFGYRDAATQAILLQTALRANDLGGAMRRMDAVLRAQPMFESSLFPLLGAILAQPAGVDAVAPVLAPRPGWRTEALNTLAAREADPAPVTRLFADLARRGSPATPAEQDVFLTRLVRDQQFAPAQALWRASLPRGAPIGAAPYDGGFRGLPGSPPFNWRLDQDPGVEAEFSDGTLRIDYPAKTPAVLARQLVVLAPGAYRLSGAYEIRQPAPGVGLTWSVQCATPPGAVLGQALQSADVPRAWSRFSAGFFVPADCPAQWLTLTGGAGDAFGDVSAAYARLAISAAPPP